MFTCCWLLGPILKTLKMHHNFLICFSKIWGKYWIMINNSKSHPTKEVHAWKWATKAYEGYRSWALLVHAQLTVQFWAGKLGCCWKKLCQKLLCAHHMHSQLPKSHSVRASSRCHRNTCTTAIADIQFRRIDETCSKGERKPPNAPLDGCSGLSTSYPGPPL